MRPSLTSSSGRSVVLLVLELDFETSRWSICAEPGTGCGSLLSLSGRSSGFYIKHQSKY
jgi:hypothetical protein